MCAKKTATTLNNTKAMENDFWHFSLKVYRQPTVADLCLNLQNKHQLEVNELLFVVWLAMQGRQFDVALLNADNELRHLQQQVILPLRQARQTLGHVDKTSTIYQYLKQSELALEQVIQHRLWQNWQQFPATSVTELQQVERNLQILWQSNQLITANVAKKTEPPELIQFCEWMIGNLVGKI